MVALGGLTGFSDPVHPTPAADDTFDVLGGAGEAHRQEPLFRLGRGHAGERPHLGVGELTAGEGLGQPR
jgi:hypothetical protein